MKRRSSAVTEGVARAPHRSLLKADGVTDEEMGRPLVAVFNSRNDIVPGHNDLDKIAEAVKAGIYLAGGVPFEISTIGVCDGIAMNHDGMHYSLVSREVIADSLECAVQGHAFDALVCIPNCDKIVPGMLLGALRVNIPTVFVSGGPMLAGTRPGGCGPATDLNTLFDGAAAVASGTMTEDELNPVWQHLLNGEIDILVCTTLIETGIDVRNCNTLIIEDADRMGLAQLYQIRGRVGRSGRKAYAYFTFRRDKTLSDIAQKRLSAIREFTAFGSGFRIAMRDLQIRGAGSLLGHSQHGHMEAVGYDLYVKMLNQAIARAKGEPLQRDKSECLVDLRVDAFIPEKYIADGPGRIEAYKRIAAIQTPEDAADVLDELIDRYGDPPPSVSDLVNVSLVRVQAAAVGVYEVTQKKDTLLLQVEELDLGMIRGLLIAFNGRVTAGAGAKPYLSVTLQPDEKPLELLQSILKAMGEILNEPKPVKNQK